MLDDDDANIIGSVLDLFKGHDTVYGGSARNIVLFSCSGLHTLLSSPDVEEFRPICLQIQLNFTPFEDVDAWKHFGRLSDHDKEFTALFFQLSCIKSIRLGLLFREELIAQRTKVVVIGMIDKAGVFFVETLHYALLGAGLIFVETLLRVGLVKVIGPATTAINSAKEPIPFEKRIVSGETSEIN